MAKQQPRKKQPSTTANPSKSSKPSKQPASSGRPPARTVAARTPQKRFPVFWVALGAVIVIAGIAAIVASAGGSDSDGGGSGGKASGHEYGTVTVTGKALPTLSPGGADPAVGTTIPTVKGENFSGAPVTITPDGTPQMVVFLAHWCPHCNAEAPKLAAYLQDHGGAPPGVELTIVPTGSNAQAPNWPPSQWVKNMGLGGVRTLVDDQDGTAAAAFGLDAYPFIVAIDKDGTVVDRRSGEQADGFFADAFGALANGSAYPG